LATPKSRQSRRVLDLDPGTVTLLERYRVTQREGYLRFGVTARASDRVFTNEIGDPLQPKSVGQAFRRRVADAGVPMILCATCAGTHASHLLMAGINIKVVSERLGHASVSGRV
jgi:site-specific recombinase XerD